MAYIKYVDNKPVLTDSGSLVVQHTRTNIEALRDAIVAGIPLPGWAVNNYGGTGAEPTTIVWTYDTGVTVLYLRATPQWGTTGFTNGNPMQVQYHFSAGGSTWEWMGTQIFAYDASGNCQSITWSLPA